MEILIAISFIIIGLRLFINWYNSPKQKGERGEAYVHLYLSELSPDYNLIEDIILPTEKGTTQIDHIIISKFGVFTIETKNYRGEIYGDDERKEWTQIIKTDVTYSKKLWKTYTYITKNKFYNPVKQSLGHAYHLKRSLSEWSHLPIIPLVVFTGDCSLAGVSSKHHVIYDHQLLHIIDTYKTIYITDNEVLEIKDKLTKRNIREFVNNKSHIQNIKEAKQSYDENITMKICPKCGSSLILRNGKYGSFLGCSNYPTCKFTFKINN